MARTLSTTISSAITQSATKPVYLARIGFSVEIYVATWDTAIAWGGKTWIASGMGISRLTSSGAILTFPSTDTWLSLVLNEGTRQRDIFIYEYQQDTSASPQADAVLIFQAEMDEVTIGTDIRINVIEASRARVFPPGVVDQPVFRHLLPAGSRIQWAGDTIVVN